MSDNWMPVNINDLNKIDALEREVASLKALLKELEWHGPRGMNCCNFCEGWKETGHTPNCKLSKAIKE